MNHEILLRFAYKPLRVNEGIAIDAWLVTSVSQAIINDGLTKFNG